MPEKLVGSLNLADIKRGRLLRLEPNDDPRTIEEGIEARIKDPLWMLGRQRQMAEFRARSSASVVRTEVDASAQTPTRIGPKAGPANQPIDPSVPLEAQVEAESSSATPAYWCKERWIYSLAAESDTGARLSSGSYWGDRLDWFDFDLTDEGYWPPPSVSNQKPVHARFPGAPHSRWWTLEDRRVDLGGIRRPELNLLNVLAMEFSLLFENDWYLLPLTLPVGQLRKVQRLTVVDSFGFATDAEPVVDRSASQTGFEAFTLSRGTAPGADGRVFFMPHTRHVGLQGAAIEKVSALRDEAANLVWAIEHCYQDESGEIVRRDEEARPDRSLPPLYWDRDEERLVLRGDVVGENEPGKRFLGPVEKYEPQSYVPPHWIPYQAAELLDSGQLRLRRSRTQLDVSTGPQYRSKLVSESKMLNESAVSPLGTRIERAFQLVRTTDGRRFVWLGRRRYTDEHREPSGLRFDALLRSQ
jgi:hypothetical protein